MRTLCTRDLWCLSAPLVSFDNIIVAYFFHGLFYFLKGLVVLKTYNTSDCNNDDYTSTKIGSEGCKEPDDELYDDIYHMVSCSTEGPLPLQGSYDLFKYVAYISIYYGFTYQQLMSRNCIHRAYVGNKDVALFEANPVNTCIDLVADHSFSFGHFNKEPNYLIYDSQDCSGQSSTETLEQDYTEFSDHSEDFPMDAEIVYTWEYYDSRSN